MKQKSLLYFSNMVAYTLVFMGLIALINYTSFQHYKRLDFTKYRRYSLSSQTVKLLERLPYQIDAKLFVKNNPAIRSGPKTIMQQYEYHGKKLNWEFIDPDKKPDIAQKYDVAQYNTYIVEGRHGKMERFSGEFSEAKMTNAILRIISTKEKVVYFTRGHGEKNLSGTDSAGYSEIRVSLKKENFIVKDILLFSAGDMPQDAAVVVVAGPQKDLSGYEIRKLEKFIDSGGKLLFLVDPFTLDESLELLAKYGIVMHDDIIVDRASRMFGGDVLIPTVANYLSHILTDEFRLTTLYPLARSLEIEEVDPTSNLKVQGLGQTVPSAWGETSREELEGGEVTFAEDKDRRGPLFLSAVAEIKITQPKATEGAQVPDGETVKRKTGALIVVGDSDFVTNSHIRLSGNRDFFLNAVNWLAQEESRISIRAKKIPMDPIRFTIPQLYTIAGISVVGLPGLVLGIGIWVNIRRRRS